MSACPTPTPNTGHTHEEGSNPFWCPDCKVFEAMRASAELRSLRAQIAEAHARQEKAERETMRYAELRDAAVRERDESMQIMSEGTAKCLLAFGAQHQAEAERDAARTALAAVEKERDAFRDLAALPGTVAKHVAAEREKVEMDVVALAEEWIRTRMARFADATGTAQNVYMLKESGDALGWFVRAAFPNRKGTT